MAMTVSPRRAPCLRAAITRAAVWTAFALGAHILIFDALAIVASDRTVARGPEAWPSFNLEFRFASDDDLRPADEPVRVEPREFIDRRRVPSRRDPVEPLDPDYIYDVLDAGPDPWDHRGRGFQS